MAKKVFWAMLMERNVPLIGATSAIRMAHVAGKLGYNYLAMPYARTDFARNALAERFMQLSTEPDDTLLMLDNDHDHKIDTLVRLVECNYPFVGALAFRRGEPYDACAFVRMGDGHLHSMAEWQAGQVYKVQVLGHAAIAIQRRVFLHLQAEGYQPPWWRYVYTDGSALVAPSEDMYFCGLCEKAGVPQYVDTGLIAPHLTTGFIDDSSWRAWVNDHPGSVGPMRETTAGTATAPATEASDGSKQEQP
jgi:hypothetical protein